MEHIPPLGWVAIAVLVLVTLGVNAGMVALLRRGSSRRSALTPGRSARDPSCRDLPTTLRAPFREQNRQLDELSRRVEALKARPPDPPQDGATP